MNGAKSTPGQNWKSSNPAKTGLSLKHFIPMIKEIRKFTMKIPNFKRGVKNGSMFQENFWIEILNQQKVNQ